VQRNSCRQAIDETLTAHYLSNHVAATKNADGRKHTASVAEVSVYVEPASHGRGIGKALLQALVDASEQAGFWTLTAGVFPENAASLALHLACGFRVVGTRERVGCLHGVWRDVVLLERRSQRVGV
jgi:phosphinothricin acetyltransferase